MMDVFARDGVDVSRPPVVLVVGPPGAGKSTFVQDARGEGDVVVDYDLIAEAFGHRPHTTSLFDAAEVARNAVLTALRKGTIDTPRAWVVSSNPLAETLFSYDEVVLIDPGRDEVLARCRKSGRPSAWFGLVDGWYRKRGVDVRLDD